MNEKEILEVTGRISNDLNEMGQPFIMVVECGAGMRIATNLVDKEQFYRFTTTYLGMHIFTEPEQIFEAINGELKPLIPS